MDHDIELKQLVEVSRFYGSKPDFVLAGGGNTSFKTESVLYVKASGCALADIDAPGFVELVRQDLSALLDSDLGSDPTERENLFKAAILRARLHPELGQRPSVECTLHNLLPCKFVVHTHSTYVNMLACSPASESRCKDLFDEYVLWAPYVDPGFVLAKSLQRALAKYKEETNNEYPKAIIMENHGLIICGNTIEEIHENTDAVITKIRSQLIEGPSGKSFGEIKRVGDNEVRNLIEVIAPTLRGALSSGPHLKIVTFDDSDQAVEIACGEHGKDFALRGPLTPDQIVYCKSFPIWIDPELKNEAGLVAHIKEQVAEYLTKTGTVPKVVIVKGLGLFAAGDDYQDADAVRQVYLDAVKVMAGARKISGEVHYLSDAQRSFIENWEAENYRKQASNANRSKGRVANKVAVVTGAAQGFGLEIGQDLAKEGAYVALCDINIDGAQKAAEDLSAAVKKFCALGAGMDVSCKESVADAIYGIVRKFGGLDIFVSNAGVLKAESVKTQSEKDFDFVTSVNYKGYFLCTQIVSAVLARQHRANQNCWSDIIQINSKSGLQGSNKNGAYAGSKFGGIGLTQSFAMELVVDGIKVNSICPGNFFEGPLWSDPENGLFMQYLRAGKVPGAKSIEDIKKFYEEKVPMKRGCRTSDVMKALYYLVEQTYETGQAVPVTGGQIMLS